MNRLARAMRKVEEIERSEVAPDVEFRKISVVSDADYRARPPVPPVAAEATSRLDEISYFLRALTYGEMMDLADGIWQIAGDLAPADQVGTKITQTNLAPALHRWAMWWGGHERSA